MGDGHTGSVPLRGWPWLIAIGCHGWGGLDPVERRA